MNELDGKKTHVFISAWTALSSKVRPIKRYKKERNKNTRIISEQTSPTSSSADGSTDDCTFNSADVRIFVCVPWHQTPCFWGYLMPDSLLPHRRDAHSP